MSGSMSYLGVEKKIVSSEDLLLRHPFNMVVSGGSFSGKTRFIYRFIKNASKMVNAKFEKILYCYGIFDERMFELQNETGIPVDFHQGVPSLESLQSSPTPMLLILDDLMKEASKSDFLDIFFTKGSHHMNISVAVITQDLFLKDLKTARNNAHYIVLMRSPSGERQIRDLASQLFPGKKRSYFLEAKENATKENWGYMFIDMHPASRDELRLRTNIFPDETSILFIPRL